MASKKTLDLLATEMQQDFGVEKYVAMNILAEKPLFRGFGSFYKEKLKNKGIKIFDYFDVYTFFDEEGCFHEGVYEICGVNFVGIDTYSDGDPIYHNETIITTPMLEEDSKNYKLIEELLNNENCYILYGKYEEEV